MCKRSTFCALAYTVRVALYVLIQLSPANVRIMSNLNVETTLDFKVVSTPWANVR